MLSLEPPFIVIKDVWVFADHQDDNQFYYLPRLPRLSRDNEGNPIFKFLYIRDTKAVANGGILNFQTDLGVDPKILDEVKAKLPDLVKQQRERQKELGGKDLGKLPNNPHLVQLMPSSESTVELLLLGTSEGGTKFVTNIKHAGKPALYGDNQAIFAVELSVEGAQLLKDVLENAAAKKGEAYQVGVIYKIFFEGIKPAFRIKGEINLSEVATYVRNHKKINALFFRSDIEEITSKLVRDGKIKLDTEILTTGASAEAEKAKVMEWITKMFFEPKPNPAAPDPTKAKDPLTGIFDSLTSAVKNLQDIGYTATNLNVTQEQNITFNAEITQRTAVKHFISPQTYLTGMFKADEVSKYIDLITLNNDPYYTMRKLGVTTTADFERNSISLISVTGKYDSEPDPQSASITRADLSDPVKLPKNLQWVSALDRQGNMVRPVKVKYRVFFKEDELQGARPSQIESNELTTSDNLFVVEPFSEGPGFLFITKEVRFVADSEYPWTRYNRIEVTVEYKDLEKNINIEKSVSLLKTPASELEKKVRLFIMNPKKRSYRYKVRHVGVKSAKVPDVSEEWVETDSDAIYINEPAGAVIPGQWALKFNGNDIDWPNLKTVTVTLKEDAARGIPRLDPIALSPTTKVATFTIQMPDKDKRELFYDLKLQKKSGAPETISGSVAKNEVEIDLAESGALAGRRYMQVTLPDGDFNPNVSKIVVTLRHPYNNQSMVYTFTKQERDKPAPWIYHFRYDKERQYEYRVDYLTLKNARVASIPNHKTNFEKSEKLDLVVPMPLPTTR